jgi:ferritin-like metal-binding protein YciE
MKIENFRQAFETGLRYIYDCEQKLVEKGLPNMIEASSSPELRNAFEQHLQETRNHVQRIEEIFNQIGAKPKTEKNTIIAEMADAADNMVSATEDGSPLRDALLTISGNQVEHYEIATYGSLILFARQLGYSQAAQLLEQTLNEEKAADAKLTKIGETTVTRNASREQRAA